MVRSVKVSSARDSTPVRTAIPRVTLSFKAAGWGAARASSNRTSRITWETRACCNRAAVANGVAPTRDEKTQNSTIGPLLKVFAKDFSYSALLRGGARFRT